ncbi:MAG: hypothetical protein GF364_13535, partial [Candidatus Lokiarchaeota archaeon]|nr:hypothetical protein [Candidatus Lokiarchaeota archaeon]
MLISDVPLDGSNFSISDEDSSHLVLFDCSKYISEGFNCSVSLEFDYNVTQVTTLSISEQFQRELDQNYLLLTGLGHRSISLNASKNYLFALTASHSLRCENISITITTGMTDLIIRCSMWDQKSGAYAFKAVINDIATHQLPSLIIDSQSPEINSVPSELGQDYVNITLNDFTITSGICFFNTTAGNIADITAPPDREEFQINFNSGTEEICYQNLFILITDQAGNLNYACLNWKEKNPFVFDPALLVLILSVLGIATLSGLLIIKPYAEEKGFKIHIKKKTRFKNKDDE